MPFVSYLFSTYNIDHSYAESIIQLARSLNPKFAEVCITDGGSTNGTLSMLAACELIRVLKSAPDNGQYEAWNNAIKNCRGSFIAFLGADDIPNVRFAYDAFLEISENGKSPVIIYGPIGRIMGTEVKIFYPRPPVMYSRVFSTMALYHPGLMFRADIFDTFSYDQRFRYAADFELLISISREYPPVSWLNVNRVQALVGSNGMSSSVTCLFAYLREYILIVSKHKTIPLSSALRVIFLIAFKRTIDNFCKVFRA